MKLQTFKTCHISSKSERIPKVHQKLDDKILAQNKLTNLTMNTGI